MSTDTFGFESPAGGSDSPLRSWWAAALLGLLSLAAGLVVLIEPHTSLKAVAVVIGIYLVLLGIGIIGVGLQLPTRRGLVIAAGVLAIVAGVFVIARPGSALHGVRIVLGIYLLAVACVHFATAVLDRFNRRTDIVRGLVDLAGAIVLLVIPGLGLAAFAVIVGLYLLVSAVLEFLAAYILYQAQHQT